MSVCFATGWFAVALGLFSRTGDTAGMATVPLIMLAFLSSAFVGVVGYVWALTTLNRRA